MGTPDMSEGFHTKISMFWRRNSTSSLSSLLFKLEPTLTCLEESPGTRSTFLVSWADLNDGSWSETCFSVVCISSGVHQGSVALKFFSGKDGLSKGGFSELTLLGLLEASGHGDYTVGTRNLQLVVDVAWTCMEL